VRRPIAVGGVMIAVAVSGFATAATGTAAPTSFGTVPVAGVHWQSCKLPADYPPMYRRPDCTTVSVPLDYANPTGRKITLAVSRLPHTGPARKYQGILLVNPGGPGGSGRFFNASVAAGMSAATQAAYDIIGFDPRGVGASRPELTCDTGFFKPVRPDYVPRSRRDEDGWLRRTKAYAQACGKKWGPVLTHMKTTDSARDLDAIRSALGADRLNYYGASYGTYLGAVYATMFPSRVRRMVLDSNVRPSGVWYGDNLDQDYSFDRNLNIFFGWIAKHDKAYHLGTSEEGVASFYTRLRAKLRTAPLTAPKEASVGPDELDDTFQVAGYISLGGHWTGLARALADYRTGDSKPLVDAFNAEALTTDDNEYAVYDAVQCTDVQWPKDQRKWDADTRRVYRTAPFEAWSNNWYNAPCLYWPAPAGRPVNVRTGRSGPKVLLFQATLDAATPFDGGLEMNERLAGSRLVIEDGGLTHGIVGRGNRCIDNRFDAYLLSGALPANLTHCHALPLPVPPAGTRRMAAPEGNLTVFGRPS
jgi:pimeloyl-ACP methyl ester carboxylesterase